MFYSSLLHDSFRVSASFLSSGENVSLEKDREKIMVVSGKKGGGAMTAFDFFIEVGKLHDACEWAELEKLLAEPHVVIPGEREAFLELIEHEIELGHVTGVRLDDSGMHVIKND